VNSLVGRPPAEAVSAVLYFERSVLHGRFAETAHWLGGRRYGAGGGSATGLDGLPVGAPLAMPLLGGGTSGPALLDAWCGAADVTVARHGVVRTATDGHWLHGLAEIDEATHAGGLQGATEQLYGDVFAVLAGSNTPHLLRLWNHFADMNRETAGVERYRQFNAGRQQAFADAGRSAFDGAPAACALGTAGGPLRVWFLAGSAPPIAIENPRQVSAYRYPTRYGARSPTFSRAAIGHAGDGSAWLFISGTASIVGHETLHRGDVRRQTAESLANIDAVLAQASAHAGASLPKTALVCTVYLRDPTDLDIVRAVVDAHFGAGSPAARHAVYLQADICRADLLVEIEAHGQVRPCGESATVEKAAMTVAGA
jgi:chorismate lyase / 3-hydroxybenzoate synthase